MRLDELIKNNKLWKYTKLNKLYENIVSKVYYCKVKKYFFFHLKNIYQNNLFIVKRMNTSIVYDKEPTKKKPLEIKAGQKWEHKIK